MLILFRLDHLSECFDGQSPSPERQNHKDHAPARWLYRQFRVPGADVCAGEPQNMAGSRYWWCLGNDSLQRPIPQRLHGILPYVTRVFGVTFSNTHVTVNSSRDPVRVRDDGDKFVKLKGLSIPLHSPNMVRQKSVDYTKSPKLKTEKRVTGVRIEFTTDMDKRLFLEKFREVRGTFFAGDR